MRYSKKQVSEIEGPGISEQELPLIHPQEEWPPLLLQGTIVGGRLSRPVVVPAFGIHPRTTGNQIMPLWLQTT